MRSSLTRRRSVRRTLALSAVVGIAVFGPAMPAASAQPFVGPPPLRPTNTVGGPLSPQPGFEQTQGCMQANTGDSTIEEKPWSQLALGFEQAHEQGLTGSGKTVAVIDTGVNQHPRLSLTGNGGSAVPDGRGANFDCDGHGTIVAGIIAAHRDDSTGLIGVAPEAQIMSIRQSSKLFQNKAEKKTVGDTQTMAQAITQATNSGASVINISQSSCQTIAQASNPADEHNNRLYQAVKNAFDRGVVVVAAAGNADGACQKNPSGSPTTAVLPAWFDEYVLTVGSVGQEGQPSEFTVPGPWVDVAAPGENLISLDPGSGGSGLASQIAAGADGQMQPIQGTSFATPYVSGLAVLIKEKYEKAGTPLSAGQIMDRIKATAMHPGGNNGRNDIVGYGMIDFMAALGDIVPPEHGKLPAPMKPTRLSADVIPQKDYPALLVALGGSVGGVAAVIFTAFLVNAVRNVRLRQAEAAAKTKSRRE
ncbi:membrane-anchored mycosin MYCP [Saccharopolyspora erythraea NRRL 2338]|nr:type VII secretion-associated serine protease mycosin [Saccharopolyspora erythraea]PFG99603.1 membrane-anchored mycosin MYCP [Saccharopolyspora erythraea NRRL 2338]QRK89493.1 type VII secretion-associated serine protease mycosin [Saccharopolyspora erythraea]